MKTTFVSGTDRGLGLALTENLLKQGYRVYAGHLEPASAELEALKPTYGEQLTTLRLDISSSDSVKAALEQVRQAVDSLDVLINNAAILGDIHTPALDSQDYEEMMRVFNVNTLGSLRMSQTFMPLLLNSESKLLVNISSEAGSIGSCWREGWLAYCMSKSALNMQSRILHNAIKPSGGKVLVVHPGWVQTYMQGKLDAGATLTPAQSASAICQLIENRLQDDGGHNECEYVDYAGEPLSW